MDISKIDCDILKFKDASGENTVNPEINGDAFL